MKPMWVSVAVAAAAAAATVATVAATAATAATITAAATAAATVAATAAAAEAAGRTLFRGTSLIARALTAAAIAAVHFLRRDFGFLGGAHGDEGEAARAARHLVEGDVNVGDSAESAEGGADVFLGGL